MPLLSDSRCQKEWLKEWLKENVLSIYRDGKQPIEVFGALRIEEVLVLAISCWGVFENAQKVREMNALR
jgi:hypothetical protein